MARAALREDDPARIGRYRLIARLGEGGMGVVYLAAPEDDGRADGDLVAVKVLRPELIGDAELRARFDREVETLLRIQGVCTVRVIDADTTTRKPYLVTGVTFRQVHHAHAALAQPGRQPVGADLRRVIVQQGRASHRVSPSTAPSAKRQYLRLRGTRAAG